MPKRRPEDPEPLAPVRIEAVPRRGLSRVEAARYVGISTTTFDKLVREGNMPEPFRIGSRTIWDLRKLDLAFDVLSGPEETDSFADWDDWDAASRGQSKVEQEERLAKADAERIQARKDARRRSARRQT